MPTYRLILALLAFLPALASAQTSPSPAISVAKDIQSKLSPGIIAAIQAQNTKHATLDNAGIQRLNNQWKAEANAAEKPMIDAVLKNSVSTELKRIQKESGGKYAGILVTDNRGLIVGQTSMTPDYWQGNKDGFTRVFSNKDAIFAKHPEYVESAKIYIMEVNSIISKGPTAIGTFTVMVITKKLR